MNPRRPCGRDADAFEEPRFSIRFTGVHEDAGLDADGDGLFDYLVVRAQAQVNQPGTYAFDGSMMVPFNATPSPGFWVTSDYGTVGRVAEQLGVGTSSGHDAAEKEHDDVGALEYKR